MDPKKREKKDEEQRENKKVAETDKKVMKRKDEERTEAINTLMIASYREKYSKEALEVIRQIILQEKPEKIVILKAIEQKKPSEMVDASIGAESKKDFLESVKDEKIELADKYAEDIMDLVEKFNIPSEVHLRKGEDVAEEIIDEFENLDVDHIIMHGPKKGPLGTVIEGSISENVKKGVSTKKVTLLD
ncbi:MAG: universal stress protein [Candidatus Thermoplasmatota archaeon]